MIAKRTSFFTPCFFTLCLFALCACNNQGETRASTAAVTAAPSSSVAARPLEPSAPRNHSLTTSDALGTLPEGVGIAVGETAPLFTLPNQDGKPVALAELIAKSEVLLVFYRGGW
jgi:hypothetical protein